MITVRSATKSDARAIQRLWLDGKRDAAAHRVPDEMVTEFGAIGTADMVRARFQAYKDVGIDSLTLRFDAADSRSRIGLLEQIVDLATGLA